MPIIIPHAAISVLQWGSERARRPRTTGLRAQPRLARYLCDASCGTGKGPILKAPEIAKPTMTTAASKRQRAVNRALRVRWRSVIPLQHNKPDAALAAPGPPWGLGGVASHRPLAAKPTLHQFAHKQVISRRNMRVSERLLPANGHPDTEDAERAEGPPAGPLVIRPKAMFLPDGVQKSRKLIRVGARASSSFGNGGETALNQRYPRPAHDIRDRYGDDGVSVGHFVGVKRLCH